MYNNNHKKNSDHNGFHHSVHPISQEDNQPFPSGMSERDDNDLDRSSQPLSEQGKENLRVLRRFYISLIVTGVIIGGFFTWGIITVLSEWDLINPPEKPQFDMDDSSVMRK
ncbi:MAG: hypothetical protein ACLFQP_06660 [Halothece sp.]